jgi:hypothetical protein
MEMEVDMKLSSLFNSVEKVTIKLSENQLFSVRGKNIEIHCLYGDIWVTWPNKGERILNSGQTFRVSSKGKVCIVALSNSHFKIRKRRWVAYTQTHLESGLTNEDTDIFTIPFDTHGFSILTKKTP